MKGTVILTSAGFKIPHIAEEIVKRLPKKPQDTRLAHIFTASNVAPDTEYVRRDVRVLQDLGFQVKNYTLEGKSEEEVYNDLKDQDVVYVQGGNAFYLLRHIRESGFERVVRKLLAEGIWYIGISAGTYVCCPTIEMATWKREEKYLYGLPDLIGMGIVPFLVSVHYNREKYREKLAKAIPTASAPVKILADDQALFIQNSTVEFIGRLPEVRASDIV